MGARTLLTTALLFSSIGCGGDDDGGGPDAPVAVDAPTDAPPAPPRCAPTTPWPAPTLVLAVNTPANEVWARLTADERTMVGRLDGSYLTISERADTSSVFPVGTELAVGQPSSSFTSPSITGDGRTLYFVANFDTAPRVWRATRAAATGPFSNAAAVPELAAATTVSSVYILPDESALYLTSGPFGGQVQRAARTGGTFSTPTDVPGIVGLAPVVSADELTILFSTRPVNSNDSHPWMGTRPTTSDPFGSINQVPSLDTTSFDDPTWLSADDCRLYLRTNRPGGSGGFDIYMSERTP